VGLIRGDKLYQTTASNDMGAFVALAFERPRDFTGLELEIAESELINPEAATAEGQHMILAIISSSENIAQFDRYREISRRLTLARGLREEQAGEV